MPSSQSYGATSHVVKAQIKLWFVMFASLYIIHIACIYIYTHVCSVYTHIYCIVLYITNTHLVHIYIAFPTGGCLSCQSYVWLHVLPLLEPSAVLSLWSIWGMSLPQSSDQLVPTPVFAIPGFTFFNTHSDSHLWGHLPSISSINWWNSCFWWLGNELKSIVNFEFHRKDIAFSSTRPCTSSRMLWRRRAQQELRQQSFGRLQSILKFWKDKGMESYAVISLTKALMPTLQKLASFCIQIAHSCPLLPHINSTLVHEILSLHADTLPRMRCQ